VSSQTHVQPTLRSGKEHPVPTE